MRGNNWDRPKERFDLTRLLAGIIIGVIFVGVISFAIAYNVTRETVTCTISDKNNTVNVTSSGDDGAVSTEQIYRVYSPECGALEIKDNIFYGQFRAAESYGSITVGKRYEFDLVGFRWLAIYPTIIDIRSAE